MKQTPWSSTSRPTWLQRLGFAAPAVLDDPASLGTAFGLEISLSQYSEDEPPRSATPRWSVMSLARWHR